MSRERKGNRWTIKLCLKKLTVLGWILREDFISIIFQCRLFLLEENFFRYYLCRKWNEMENVENINVSINLIVAYDNVFFLFTDFFNDNLFIIIFTIVIIYLKLTRIIIIYTFDESREKHDRSSPCPESDCEIFRKCIQSICCHFSCRDLYIVSWLSPIIITLHIIHFNLQ